jgi:hypothetical protein
MLTIIKASLLGSALMLLENCTGYLTNYQTRCVEGHVYNVEPKLARLSRLRKSQIKGLLGSELINFCALTIRGSSLARVRASAGVRPSAM